MFGGVICTWQANITLDIANVLQQSDGGVSVVGEVTQPWCPLDKFKVDGHNTTATQMDRQANSDTNYHPQLRTLLLVLMLEKPWLSCVCSERVGVLVWLMALQTFGVKR